MKRVDWWVLIILLSALILTGCGGRGQASAHPFDALVRRAPQDSDQVFFLDLKPDGESGRHWERIRGQLEANPTGQEALDGLFQEFKVTEYGLDEFIQGPAVSGNWHGTHYVIVPVSEDGAVRDALLEHFEDVTWEQEEFEGKTLYHGRNLNSGRGREWLAWAVQDGIWFLSFRYDGQESLPQLQALVSLSEADSLAELASWRTLQGRLPEGSMGVMFINLAEQMRRTPSSADDRSVGEAVNRQIPAVALAAVPEEEGMRVEIAGTVALDPEARAEVQDLFNLSSVRPGDWPALPADTAIALFAHDMPTIWPWLKEAFGLDSLEQLREVVDLDPEADLAGEAGPLTGDFAVAITPPLPQQPISRDFPALQWLILGRDVREEAMPGVRTAMEGRGAVFGLEEINGISLQTQVGTRPSGYAISYGFLDDILFLGSSPEIIGRALDAQRQGDGLIMTPTFRAVLAALPDDPSLLIYLNNGALARLAQANMTEEQYQKNQEFRGLEAFEAIAAGLRFAPDRIDGAVYFFMQE